MNQYPLPGVMLVVPCFDEGERLQPDLFLRALKRQPGVGFCFVDDGSTDGTWAVLDSIRQAYPRRILTLRLDRNQGKAEAVRQGVLRVLQDAEGEESPDFLGYWDADLSTPLSAIPLFIDAFVGKPECRLVMGARVKLLGRNIARRRLRHYTGRVFATLISVALDLPVYDTQCGAKLFRVDDDTREVFSQPFSDPWLMDVELLARLQALWGAEARRRIFELPLQSWEHKGGSKIRPWDGIRAMGTILSIWLRRIRNSPGIRRIPDK